jgi:phosphoglucosamine mutase
MSLSKLFGTDGIRGIANKDLTAKLAYRIGLAAATVLTAEHQGRARVVIGKDTRLSSDMLEAAIVSGLCSGGADAQLLNVAPTPAVAYITAELNADAGIVISASHNPYEWNGIKIFNSKGFKLSDELEESIEALVLSDADLEVADGGKIGHILKGGEYPLADYVQHLRTKARVSKRLKIVVDCANGAASVTAERVFGAYTQELYIINDEPNGKNINEKCGSTSLKRLSEKVVKLGCDLGFAFDGDADRCKAVDELGNEIDGDKLMAICGKDMREHGILNNDIIVATIMSNLGFHEFARENGINAISAPVGDRAVLERMQREGANLGGEQSGHIIFLDDATTGDGQLAALRFLSIASRSEYSVSELASAVPEYPQVLVNVELPADADKAALMKSPKLLLAIDDAERELGSRGRIVVRPSGTESLLRVMVEAKTKASAEQTAEAIAAAARTFTAR